MWNLIPSRFCNSSNILHNYFLFCNAGYVLVLFNFFYYLQKISILDRSEILSVEYNLQSFNASEFKFVSHEMKELDTEYLTLVFDVLVSLSSMHFLMPSNKLKF